MIKFNIKTDSIKHLLIDFDVNIDNIDNIDNN